MPELIKLHLKSPHPNPLPKGEGALCSFINSGLYNGKRVLGLPREIQEVRNAFAAYEAMDNWHPASEADLLAAHALLMSMLVDQPGVFRSGGVGIFRGEHLVHMAPPADRVPYLMVDLLDWLKRSEEHPLISSCLFLIKSRLFPLIDNFAYHAVTQAGQAVARWEHIKGKFGLFPKVQCVLKRLTNKPLIGHA